MGSSSSGTTHAPPAGWIRLTGTIINNLFVRLVRRLREVPKRGLPRPGRQDDFDRANRTNTAGVVWLTNLRSKHFASGIRYEPCHPGLCTWVLDNAEINPNEFSFIDIGCGKGRALIIASRYRFREMIGIDYSPRLTKIANRNMLRCGVRDYRIACADAADFDYPFTNTFAFLYHPFNEEELLNSVLLRIRKATRRHALVVAYLGKGRHLVAKHPWLTAYRECEGATLFRAVGE